MVSCSESRTSYRIPVFDASSIHVQFQKGIVVLDNQPFTGIIYRLSDNKTDTLEIVGFRSGKEHGEWKRFHADGSLMERRFFRDGQKVGEYRAWWPNGAKKLFYHFENGEYNGVCREWSHTGVLLKEMTYKDGYEAGSQKQFYDNGKIKANYVTIEGRRYGLLGTKNCVNATDSLFKK
ncbi:toxin-antitoxin system YwqK family antitoxin [Spirosoma sp. KNUC1025]|uniref:toxin-antitoxin system YwqK family antitoxin n=1 Tax=Spirosoma sp. KNUC1025 TaxID=2894082 RepID=UPI0038670D8D|nr:toxin-antitoxin system YwqK family antitoxin [Spirosoma sp. KNUC1025]